MDGKWADKSAKHINHSYKQANQSNICNIHLSEAVKLIANESIAINTIKAAGLGIKSDLYINIFKKIM